MSKSWGTVDFSELVELRDKVDAVTQESIDAFCQDVSKELAARFLRLVVPETPVGQYPAGSGKTGGTLRRGWTAGQNSNSIAGSIYVKIEGDNYIIEIVNSVDYASYVEYGHRTVNGKGWVEGRFMMTKSEIIAEREFPHVIEKKIKQFLMEHLDV